MVFPPCECENPFADARCFDFALRLRSTRQTRLQESWGEEKAARSVRNSERTRCLRRGGQNRTLRKRTPPTATLVRAAVALGLASRFRFAVGLRATVSFFAFSVCFTAGGRLALAFLLRSRGAAGEQPRYGSGGDHGRGSDFHGASSTIQWGVSANVFPPHSVNGFVPLCSTHAASKSSSGRRFLPHPTPLTFFITL